MRANEILLNLSNVQQVANGWITSCPSHKDEKPSLSLTEKDNKILLKCFAGCEPEKICSVLGIKMKDLFFDEKNLQPNLIQKIVATYDYTDESGTLIYQNVRYEPKRFAQRKPDGKGDWIYKLEDVRRVPYHLPELLNAVKENNNCQIILTEGEKDCDNLRLLGFTASSFKNWKREFSKFIKTANVVLLIDHDKSGTIQAENAVKSLFGIVQSVKIIDLYETEPLPEKHGKDVSDWLNEGYTKEQLETIIKNAPLWKPKQEYENLGFTFGELLNLDLPPREEIIFGLGRGEVGLINAVNNVGKTTLLRNLTVSLCTGKPFAPFGNFNLPKRVAFLDFEDNLSFLRSDLSIMLRQFTESDRARLNDNALLICDVSIDDEELSLSNSFHLYSITQRLKSFAPDLIIVDTISSAFQIRDENNNAEVRRFITRPLKTLAKDCNAGVIASHHIGKGKAEEGQTKEASHKGRGASSFADMSRLVLNLEKESVENRVILSCAKIKGQKFDSAILELDTNSRWFIAKGAKQEPSNYGLVIEMFADGNEYSTKQCVEDFNGIIPERTLKRLLNEAVTNGDLKKVSHGFMPKCQNARLMIMTLWHFQKQVIKKFLVVINAAANSKRGKVKYFVRWAAENNL
ncbi:MAG TPA: AAA family ATPase [Pyrinomonadaceae bacterium]